MGPEPVATHFAEDRMNPQDIGLLLTALAGATLSGAAGVGSTLILVVIGALWSFPLRLIVLVAMFSLTMNLARLVEKENWRHVDWRRFRVLAPAAIFGAILGAVLLSHLGTEIPEERESLTLLERGNLFRFLIGGVALVYSILELLPESWRRGSRRFSAKALAALGAAYGFVSGLTALQGLSRTVVLSRFGVARREVVGTAAVTAVLVCASKLAAYQMLDLLTPRRWLFGGLFCIAAWVGVTTGREMLGFMCGKGYRRVLIATIALLSVLLVVRAVGIELQ